MRRYVPLEVSAAKVFDRAAEVDQRLETIDCIEARPQGKGGRPFGPRRRCRQEGVTEPKAEKYTVEDPVFLT